MPRITNPSGVVVSQLSKDPRDTAMERLGEYVDQLAERDRLQGRAEAAQRAVDDAQDEILEALGVLGGTVAFPALGGEWVLCADRDEDGPFLAASFSATVVI